MWLVSYDFIYAANYFFVLNFVLRKNTALKNSYRDITKMMLICII